jgi:CPA1 family monovalent cation:H+ antiporter
VFDVAIACLVLTAVLSYLNHRYVGLPTTIGVMGIALLLSVVLIGLDALGVHALREYEVSLLASIDFSDILMRGMLSILLFAGALHVDLNNLMRYKWPVGLLSVVGTLVSTLLVGLAVWYILPLAGFALPLPFCLLFGALISPTDPIAVMGIVRAAGAPKNLEIVIAGESLFNDGVGVVLFSLLLAMVSGGGHPPTLADSAMLLLREVGGGIIFGLSLGYITYGMLKSIDSYQVEILITLAAVLGGYALAHRLHVSGPLAMVMAGLLIGNQGRALAMSEKTREHLDMFWELLDEILNAILFMLLGLEVVLIAFSLPVILAMAAVIVTVLVARLLSVGTPVLLAPGVFRLPPGAWQVLTWGGLRGGISVALALSLPAGQPREVILALTYAVVVFSILGQGLTIGRVVRSSLPGSSRRAK